MNNVIDTMAKARAAIKQATHVYIAPRFGVSEHYVRISKAEALELVADIGKLNPREYEMYDRTQFGHFEEDDLYLG